MLMHSGPALAMASYNQGNLEKTGVNIESLLVALCWEAMAHKTREILKKEMHKHIDII